MDINAVSAVGGIAPVLPGHATSPDPGASRNQAASTTPAQANTPAPTNDATAELDQNDGVVVSLSPQAAALYGSSNAP